MSNTQDLSWKIGNRERQGINNTLTVDSLTVNNFTLIKAYKGKFIIQGELDVSGNTTFHSHVQAADIDANIINTYKLTVDNQFTTNCDVDINGNLVISNGTLTAFYDVDICGNAYLYNNLIFGNNITYLHSDISGNLGINTNTPTSTLDISGTTANTINVYSSQPYNFNVLSRNSTNQGISMFSNTTTSRIGFYNDQPINETTTDAKIQYTSPGIITIDVSDNTFITSKLTISNTSNPAHKLNETVIIYDIDGATPYLYNTYQSDNSHTGNTLTLVANDNSSNTMMNILTPNLSGMAIGGGTYINDTSRSLGTIGLATSNGYYPSVNLVSGKSNVQYKQTMGINTHAPILDKYVVDLNGPIHIQNGEITLTNQSNFEILYMSVSRQSSNYGIAVGTPYNVYRTGQRLQYKQTILYTLDGGNNWKLSLDLSGRPVENTLSRFTSTYVLDQLSVIVSDNNIESISYSSNGGQNWYSITGIGQALTSVYISSQKRVFVSYNGGLYWFDIPTNIYTLNQGFSYNSNNNANIDLSTVFNQIYQIDGSGDTIYILGKNSISGNYIIAKTTTGINIPSNVNTVHTSTRAYTSISVFSPTNVVAVGNNIISYTQDGIHWTDINTNYVLNRVYMYNSTVSIAVGNNGTVLCSKDGNATWNIIPPNLLASSGTEGILLDSSYNLTNVVMLDNHSFIISKLNTSFSVINNVYTYGNTSVIHCFMPNLFDNTNNYIFDLSGSSRFSGDINVLDGGKIATNNPTFYLLNETAKSIYVGSDASFISVGNSVDSSVVFNHDMVVMNDSSLNSDISVGGMTRLLENVYITGDSSMNSRLFVSGDVSLNQTLNVGKNTVLQSKLYVINDVSMGSNLVVLGDSSMNGRLAVGNVATLNNKLYVLNDVSMGSNVVVLGDSSMNGRLTVDKVATLNNKLYVINDVSMGGNLVINKDASFNGNLRVSNNQYVLGDASVNGNLFVSQNATIATDLTVQNVVYSKWYEGIAQNTDIYIGGLGLNPSNGNPAPSKKIFIGSNGGIQNTNNLITIGGGNDTVVLGGAGITLDKVNAGKYFYLNNTGTTPTYNSSAGAGIYIIDNSNSNAGYIAVSNDMSGYIFKAPSSINRVKFDINSIALSGNMTSGVLVIKPSVASSLYSVDSSFTIGVGVIETGNLVSKRYSQSDLSQNTQIIDTSMGVLGNMYVLNNFAVGKTTNRPNLSVDLSGNTYTDKLCISTLSSNPNYQMELSGNMFQGNGLIWQF